MFNTLFALVDWKPNVHPVRPKEDGRGCWERPQFEVTTQVDVTQTVDKVIVEHGWGLPRAADREDTQRTTVLSKTVIMLDRSKYQYLLYVW
jgi:hypothetical protein